VFTLKIKQRIITYIRVSIYTYSDFVKSFSCVLPRLRKVEPVNEDNSEKEDFQKPGNSTYNDIGIYMEVQVYE
jgi:hypothetical protein